MDRTPGFILPSSYPSQMALEKDLHRRDQEAGFEMFDPNQFIHSSDDVDIFLEHHGVKGMKWGVRRAAKKDAKEFARAKMFYGEGAGNRRKIIKGKVEGRSAKDPTYKKLFEEHLAKQDPARHATKAVSERHRKDFKKRNTQRAGLIARTFTGEMGNQAAFTAVAVGGVAFLASPKGQALVKNTVSKVKSSAQARRGAKLVTDFMKTQGR